jgi:membrane dipeptidase
MSVADGSSVRLGEVETFGDFDFRLSESDEQRAAALHETSVIVDLLCQGPCGYRSFTSAMEDEIREYLSGANDMEDATRFVRELPIRHAFRTAEDRTIVDCWRASGVTAGSLECPFVSLPAMLKSLAFAAAKVERFPWLVRATHPDHIRGAKEQGRIAGFVNSQYSVGLGTDLELLERAGYLGLAMLQLTYNAADHVGFGCMEPSDPGLTGFGAQLLARANALGIIVDTSHCGRQTTLDACARSTSPVVASHTSAAALYGHERAKSDEEIKAIAETDGVIGVYALTYFLSPDAAPSIDALLDNLDYISDLVGWRHVAIGTDWPLQMPKSALRSIFQPWTEEFGFGQRHRVDVTRNLEGFDDFRDWPNITRGLVARGYADDEIRGILGENFLRVFEAVVG